MLFFSYFSELIFVFFFFILSLPSVAYSLFYTFHFHYFNPILISAYVGGVHFSILSHFSYSFKLLCMVSLLRCRPYSFLLPFLSNHRYLCISFSNFFMSLLTHSRGLFTLLLCRLYSLLHLFSLPASQPTLHFPICKLLGYISTSFNNFIYFSARLHSCLVSLPPVLLSFSLSLPYQPSLHFHSL